MFNIKLESDFNSGAKVIVNIPENEIDKKAFNTLKNDRPKFILPFITTTIDNEVQISYSIGKYEKLTYQLGDMKISSYIDMWLNILQPMMICKDWFLNIQSFVADLDYIFYDRDESEVKYIYIPSTNQSVSEDDIKSLIIKISDKMKVSDMNLENKVLRELRNINPKSFIEMLKDYKLNNLNNVDNIKFQAKEGIKKEYSSTPNVPSKHEISQSVEFVKQEPLKQEIKPQHAMPEYEKKSDAQKNSEDKGKFNLNREIVLGNNSVDSSKKTKEKELKQLKKGFSLFGGQKKEKQAKLEKEVKEQNKGFFGNNKKNKGILITPEEVVPTPQQEPRNFVNSYDSNHYENDLTDATQLLSSSVNEGSILKYIGSSNHDRTIKFHINLGNLFTIGRFDSTIGKKQSDYEFVKNTKAVSRRHALIERNANGYFIVDLNSSAGTYLNNQKLPPNTPFHIKSGDRISFGNAGADYMFEE